MASKTVSTRTLRLSDISTLIPLLNRTEYNSKVALKQLNRTFRNHKSFELPDATPEETKRYLYNNLIDLKNLLNSLELGEKQEETTQTDSEY